MVRMCCLPWAVSTLTKISIRISDKARYKEMLEKSQQLQDELRTRLQIMERKARKLEQLDRDSNQIKTQPSEIKELETVKETLANVESELSEKKQFITSLSVELSDKKLELSTAETRLEALTRRLEELAKSEEQLHVQLESFEKDSRNAMFKISDLQRDLSDAKVDLEEEKIVSQRYRDRLEQQQAEFDEKITGYRNKIDELRQLVERIMDEKEALFREGTTKADVLQRENGKLNQEKEALARNLKHVTSALQAIAKDMQHLSTQMQQRDRQVVKQIEDSVRSADFLKGEVKRLGTTVADLTTSSNSKIEEAKRQMLDQLESSASNLRMANAKIELANNEIQELRANAAKSAEEWARERLKMQHDFDNSSQTVQSLNEEIQKLKSGSRGLSQEEVDEIVESQKAVFREKMADMRAQSDAIIVELRDAKDKIKLISDDNTELARRLSLLKQENLRITSELERASMSREDFFHHYARSVDVHDSFVAETDKKIAALTEQQEATAAELSRMSDELATAKATVTEKIVYTAAPSEEGVVSLAIAAETSEAGVQTDPMKAERERRHDDIQVIPGEEIVYGKIEALVKESLVTSNLYFSKESETFSNTYPIDENFLKDLVNSFVNMAQGIREMAKQVRAKDIESIVSAVAKDLIFKLDKARDESVLKIKAEQADVMAERIDETIQMMRRDKEAALYEQKESFERELAMAKSRTDKEIKRFEDMLSDQREMFRKELRKAREQWEQELEIDDHVMLPSFSSEPNLDIFNGEPDAVAPAESQQETTTMEEKDATTEENRLRASMVGVLRRAKSSKRGSTLAAREADLEILKAQWKIEFEDAIRGEIRKDIEAEMNARQLQQKMHLMRENGLEEDEVDRQILELWKELPDRFKDMDLAQMKNELLNGSLSHIGDVRMENFDRLRNKGFGTDDIIQLTILEHHMRYDGGDKNEDGTPLSSQQARQYKMQLKTMEIQRNMLLHRVVQQTNILDLLSYLHATDVHMQLLSTLNAWRSLLYYSAGGIFKDVLAVHLEVLEKCIKSSGGLKAAMSNLSFMSPDSPTDQWPQYFRVKALELFRSQLMTEARDLKKSMASALKFLQDKNTLTVLHGVKLNSTLQDAVAAEQRTEDPAKRLKADHKMVLAQLKKSYHAVSSIVVDDAADDDTAASESKDAFGDISIDLRSTSSIEPAESTPTPALSGRQEDHITPIVSARNTTSQRTTGLKAQESFRGTPRTPLETSQDLSKSASSLKPTKAPSSSRLTQNAEAATATTPSAAPSTAVSAKAAQPSTRSVAKDLKRSDSATEKPKASTSSQTATTVSKPVAPQLSAAATVKPLAGASSQQNNTPAPTANPKPTSLAPPNPSTTQKPATFTPPASASSVVAKPQKTETLLSPTTRQVQQPARVKNADDIKDLKKAAAPDLHRLAFEETFTYEPSTTASEAKQVDETAPVVVRATIIAPFHPILDELLLQAVQGDAKSKTILLSIDEAFKHLTKGDRVGCNATLNTLSNHGDLQEIVRYLQRDVSMERSSPLIDDVRSKILKIVAILEKQDSLKVSSAQPAVPQPRLSMIPIDLPPVSATSQSHPPAPSLFPSTQMFDCATQTPVYKDSTIVGHKSKSRRPERSTRVNEVYVPSQDRADDDSRRKGLPPGFILANFRDDEFEVAPGLYLVKLSTVESTLRGQPLYFNPDQSVEELMKKVTILPSNVFYCRGSKDSPEAQELKSADFVLDLPVVEGCFPLLFPSVFPLQQGANLITGYQYIGQGNEYVFGNLKYNRQRNSSAEIVSLPHDLLLLQIADDLPLPYGIYPVQISPRLVVSDDCTSSSELMTTIRDQIPPSHELVQILNCAIDFPVGLEIAPGIKVAATPLGLVLPECVRLVKKEKSTPLPEFMAPIKFMSSADETGPRPLLRNGCMVIEKPKEFFFDLGMEIVYRPPGFALPPGTRLVPVDEHPPDFILPPNHELIQLEPLFDLPEGARLTPSWLFCKRPFAVQLPPSYYFVHPDFSLDDHSIPPLPHYACIMPMPALPPGVVLPPRSKLIKLNIARLTPFPLPEGAILGPGLIVVNPQKTYEGHVCELRRPAVNALVIRRDPDSLLPPGVQRGSRSDLPHGVLLEEHMEVVRIPVRFELPIGVKLDSNVVLGANVQLAPGTRLQSGVTQMGNRAAPYLTVLPWPHGVTLPRGTELVKRIPPSIPLPFEFQVVHNCDSHAIPPDAMVVQLPKKLYLPSLLEISEQIVFGVESVLDSFHRALPAGMVLVSRQSSNAQWPPELTPVHHRELPKKLAQLLEQREKDAANSLADSYQAFKSATRRPGLQVRMNINIEVARLRSQIDFPGGVEIVQGVMTLSRPYWAMPMHNVVLVQLPETGTEEAQRRLEAHGFYKVRLRSEVASSQYVVAPRTSSSRAVSRASTAPTTASAVDWSLPPRSIFVQLPDVFDVYSWREVLPGVESVSHIEGTHGMALPPSHFLIQRPRHRLNEELPAGFQLGISEEYRNMRLLTLPPQVEIMHVVPVRYLPRGVNIINTSVLTKNSYNNMTGAMFMGLGGTTYTKKLFDPRWIPRVSPFEPISSKAVVLPWPENACRTESILDYFREGNMLIFVRDQVSQRPNTGDDDGDQNRGVLERNYPSNIVKQRESDLVVASLHKIIGDPQKDSFLLNVPTDFSQLSLDRGIPVCKIELVQISDGFPSPVDRMKAPQRNSHSHANMRHLAAVSEEATVFPRISRIKRQDYIDPAIELNRFLSEVSVFLFGKSEKDVKRELDHLGFDFIEKGIDKLMISIEQLKGNCQHLEGDLQQERGENRRLQSEIDSLSEQVHALQMAVQTDDDLRAIIEKLKSLLGEKEAEVKRLREMTTEVQERLQRQVDVLTTQIAQQGQEEEDKREQQLATLKVQLEQQLQQRSSHENLVPTISGALALYGVVVSAFAQDFVSIWCETAATLGSSYEAMVTSALQAAMEKRQKLQLQLGPTTVEAGKLSSPPRSAVRLASSLEDDDANESIGWQSASMSFPSHSMSELVADAHGKPLSVSESFPLDVRSLYKTAEMLPSAEFLNFSKPVKPKNKRGAQMSQSASLPVLPPLSSMQADAMSLVSDFSRASRGSSITKRTETQLVAPLSIEPVPHESLVDTKALLVTVDEFFRLSTESLRSRACTDPSTFLATPSADLLAGLRSETNESKRLVQERCRVTLERLAKSRDQATMNTIVALECENQLLFMHHLQLGTAGHKVTRDAGSVASDLRFRDDDVDGASTIDKSTVFEGLEEGPSVSLEKKVNKLRDLEATVLKYENQLFKAGLSPVENLAKHLQEAQHLRQQLKLMMLLLRRRCRTEEVFVGDKRAGDGRRLEPLHSQSEIDPEMRAKEVKAAKFRIARLTKQISLTEERLTLVDQDIRQTMLSILDHVESYQRCVQSLLPPRMFHQFLTKSAQYYDKMRNLTQDNLANPAGSVLSISSGSVSMGSDGIRSRVVPGPGLFSAASTSTSSLPPHVVDGRVVGGIGTMPASNSAVHLRGKLRPSSVAQTGAFRNAAPILPSLR